MIEYYGGHDIILKKAAQGEKRPMFHPKIAIFMSTYNGQAYLSGQLDSIGTQTYKNWELWVSDDGSIDNTLQILKDYQNRMGDNRFFIYAGPRKGFSANFLSLVCKKNSDADYYAYSDQDDIWAPDKLQQAINWLNTISKEIPALYCARTKLVNKHGKAIGSSPLFKKNPGFLNALVQNVAGGNTMVFNRAALNLLRTAGDKINVVAYDWWTYLLVAMIKLQDSKLVNHNKSNKIKRISKCFTQKLLFLWVHIMDSAIYRSN